MEVQSQICCSKSCHRLGGYFGIVDLPGAKKEKQQVTMQFRIFDFRFNVVDLRSSPRFVVHVVYLLGFFNSRIFSPWPHNLQGLFYEDIESCNRLLMRPFEKQGNRNASGHLDG